MIIYEDYPNKEHPQSGLVVAIERDGIRAAEIAWVTEDLLEGIGDRWVVTTGLFSWSQYRERYRGYPGDNGKGRVRERLAAGATSLLAHYGGPESLFRRRWVAEDYAYEEAGG